MANPIASCLHSSAVSDSLAVPVPKGRPLWHDVDLMLSASAVMPADALLMSEALVPFSTPLYAGIPSGLPLRKGRIVFAASRFEPVNDASGRTVMILRLLSVVPELTTAW